MFHSKARQENLDAQSADIGRSKILAPHLRVNRKPMIGSPQIDDFILTIWLWEVCARHRLGGLSTDRASVAAREPPWEPIARPGHFCPFGLSYRSGDRSAEACRTILSLR